MYHNFPNLIEQIMVCEIWTVPMVGFLQMVCVVLAPGRLHTGVHHGVRPHRTGGERVLQAWGQTAGPLLWLVGETQKVARREFFICVCLCFPLYYNVDQWCANDKVKTVRSGVQGLNAEPTFLSLILNINKFIGLYDVEYLPTAVLVSLILSISLILNIQKWYY
jgi:hypothetical protein